MVWKTWSSGVDWITATGKRDDDTGKLVTDQGIRILREKKREGKKMQPCRFLGFTGFASEGVRLATREHDVILQVSGDTAHREALRLNESGSGFKITRLDFEITAQATEALQQHEFRLYQEWLANRRRHNDAREVCHSFREHFRRGATFMVGSRRSEQHCVFYNKTAEQKGKVAANLHRAELRYTGTRAAMMFDALVTSESPMELCHKSVRAFCTKHRIPCDWLGGDCSMRMPTTYTPSDDERRMEWLLKHVSKTAQQLQDRYGPGTVENLLGLSQTATGRNKPRFPELDRV